MTAPRLAIVGAGRMGAAVRALASERGWPVAAEIGRGGNAGGAAITRERLAGADVAIEFTTPDAAPDNAIACARAGMPVVVGTTGWLARQAEVEAAVRESDGALFWAPNFSLGVNVFWRVAERAAALMATLPGFDAHVLESHHVAKRDAPSGTALETARRMDASRPPTSAPVPIHSVRLPGLYAHQEVLFSGPGELLTLRHDLFSPQAFAPGIVAALRYAAKARGMARGIEHAFAG